MFQLLAPLYAAAGQHPAALGLGAGLINVGALAGAMWLAARRLPPIVLAGLSLTTAVCVIRTGPLLTSDWNPHLLALPVLLCFWLAVTVGVVARAQRERVGGGASLDVAAGRGADVSTGEPDPPRPRGSGSTAVTVSPCSGP